MKTPEQVLTELAKDEFSFDLGYGPALLTKAEMLVVHQSTMTPFATPPERHIVSNVGRHDVAFDLVEQAYRHYSAGLLGEFRFTGFMRFEGLKEIIEYALAGQIRMQIDLGVFKSPYSIDFHSLSEPGPGGTG